MLDSRFIDTVCVIEANDFARHYLWAEYSDSLTWEEDINPITINIGEIDHRPISIAINFVKLNNKRVAFYQPISQVVDWVQVEKWIKNQSPDAKKFEPLNFHLCFQYILSFV